MTGLIEYQKKKNYKFWALYEEGNQEGQKYQKKMSLAWIEQAPQQIIHSTMLRHNH